MKFGIDWARLGMKFNNTEIIMQQGDDDAVKIDERMENETVWLSKEATVAKIATVQAERDYLECIKLTQKKLKSKKGDDRI